MANLKKVGNGTAAGSRKHKRGSGRERVLDAYAAILREEGESAATIDEVAHQADISKGGLLHHFGSKEALLGGLLERLVNENRLDIDKTLASDANAVTAYLTTCMNADDNYSQTYLAVMKLAGSTDPRVDQVLNEVLAAWNDALEQRISDPSMARLIQLLGDGLYAHALIRNSPDHRDQEVLALAQRLVSAG